MSDQHGADPDSVLVRYWGTRGSLPSPGPETVIFGGNTPCVEVRYGDTRWIFDGGTGIRSLGSALMASGRRVRATVLLSHYHWDHVQGLPFFSPLYAAGTELTIVGPVRGDYGVDEMFDHLMAPPHFPVTCEHVQASLTTHDVGPGSLPLDGPRVDAIQARHSPRTLGYRLAVGGRIICYIPDNELGGGEYDTGPEWEEELRSFVEDADLLIHDAMFLEDEYPQVVGWGHSTVEQATTLSQSAGVKRLVLFHHAPDRSDSALIDIVSRQRKRLSLDGSGLKVWAAREGETDVL